MTGQTGQIDDGKEKKMKTENGFQKSRHVHYPLIFTLSVSTCVCVLCMFE